MRRTHYGEDRWQTLTPAGARNWARGKPVSVTWRGELTNMGSGWKGIHSVPGNSAYRKEDLLLTIIS